MVAGKEDKAEDAGDMDLDIILRMEREREATRKAGGAEVMGQPHIDIDSIEIPLQVRIDHY